MTPGRRCARPALSSMQMPRASTSRTRLLLIENAIESEGEPCCIFVRRRAQRASIRPGHLRSPWPSHRERFYGANSRRPFQAAIPTRRRSITSRSWTIVGMWDWESVNDIHSLAEGCAELFGVDSAQARQDMSMCRWSDAKVRQTVSAEPPRQVGTLHLLGKLADRTVGSHSAPSRGGHCHAPLS